MKYSDRKNRQGLYLYTHIYPIHIKYILRWWFHLGSAYLHIMMKVIASDPCKQILNSLPAIKANSRSAIRNKQSIIYNWLHVVLIYVKK